MVLQPNLLGTKNTHNQKRLLIHRAENQCTMEKPTHKCCKVTCQKNYHSGERQSQIQKQLSAWNSNPTFQEMAAGGCILVNWVLTLTKSHEIKPLHTFVNLKLDCSSYISPFCTSSKVENEKNIFTYLKYNLKWENILVLSFQLRHVTAIITGHLLTGKSKLLL